MAKLWQKEGLKGMNPDVEKYEVGSDYIYDGRLFYYELSSSMAHSKMLEKIGILSGKESKAITDEIKSLYKKYGRNITLQIEDEDIHSKLENLLIGAIGEAGKKLHTGRSRNDQVLTVLRLYEKDMLLDTAVDYIDCLGEFALLSAKEGEKILPGYTHTKQAMLMNVKFWASSFIDTGLDNIKMIKDAYDLIDANPLGSGSGFGVPIPVDRDMTAEMLGFSRVQENAMAVQNSRGKFEAFIIDVLWAIMHDFSRMASDLLLFNMDELNYLLTDESVTTGSSIMPQKRNLDVLELVRARTFTMMSYSTAVKSISGGIVSGYNKDLQETKEPLIKAFDLILETIAAVKAVIKNICFDEKAVKARLSKGIAATDLVFELQKDGLAFRDAYRTAAGRIKEIEIDDSMIEKSIKNRVSRGSPGALNLKGYLKALENEKVYFVNTAKRFKDKLAGLVE